MWVVLARGEVLCYTENMAEIQAECPPEEFNDKGGLTMKKATLFLLACVIWLIPAVATALEVPEAVITTAVVDRTPVDAVESYPATAGKLYCFTRITGAAEDTFVTHVWYYQDDEMARVDLPVRSSNWRTWSSKSFLPSWEGDWRVDVLDAQGNVMASLPFTLI